MSAPLVFVNCVGKSASTHARRLASGLASQLGSDRVVAEAGGGEASRQVERCDVMVAGIADGWLRDDDSFARQVELALTRRIPVIPVLILGAEVPDRDRLPDGLKGMLDNYPRASLEIPSEFLWDVSVSHLGRWLIAIGEEKERTEKAKAAAAEHSRRLEHDVERTHQRQSDSEAAATAAERRYASLQTELQAATDELARSQSALGPAGVNTGVRVFLSYRAENSGDARKLESDLKERLPEGRVLTSEPVPAGAAPEAIIGERVARCDALLAIIGPHWLTTTDTDGRPRLSDPEDPIRLETAAALSSGLPVIPILTQHAVIPEAAALPEDLRALANASALELLVPFWEEAVNALVERLKQVEHVLRQRRNAVETASERHRKLESEASKVKADQAKAEAAVAAAKDALGGLEQDLLRARAEHERLSDEHDDLNRAFLDGPGEDIGTAPARRGEWGTALARRDPRLVWAGALAILVLLLIIVVI
jgi:predicted  nucleic acid-binding Zn-ribbon protein